VTFIIWLIGIPISFIIFSIIVAFRGDGLGGYAIALFLSLCWPWFAFGAALFGVLMIIASPFILMAKLMKGLR
jgi:hypothetical protein